MKQAKKTAGKLTLAAESIRALSADQLGAVGAGSYYAYYYNVVNYYSLSSAYTLGASGPAPGPGPTGSTH